MEGVQVLTTEVKQVMLVVLVEDRLFMMHQVLKLIQVMLVDLIHLKEI